MISILASHNRLRPWALWLALCVAWFAALAPTLSHAVPFALGNVSAGTEICSAQGTRMVPAQDGNSEPKVENRSDSTASPHCSFCLHQAERMAPVISIAPMRFMVPGDPHLTTYLQETFLPRNNGFGPPPRGPPSSFDSRIA